MSDVYGGTAASESDPSDTYHRYLERRRSSLPGYGYQRTVEATPWEPPSTGARRLSQRRCSTRHAGVINEARLELRSAKQQRWV